MMRGHSKGRRPRRRLELPWQDASCMLGCGTTGIHVDCGTAVHGNGNAHMPAGAGMAVVVAVAWQRSAVHAAAPRFWRWRVAKLVLQKNYKNFLSII